MQHSFPPAADTRSPLSPSRLAPSAPHLATFIAILLLLLFGYEIFNFSLSIDEELHANDPGVWLQWIAQGRWMMGLLARAVPPLASIPMLSTALFCAGLGFSAWLLSRLLFTAPLAQRLFAGLLVSSPVWPHIAEFNTLSWGVGFGLALVAWAVALLEEGRRWSVFWAVVLVAAATGIYQSLFFFFLVLVCLRLSAEVLMPRPPSGAAVPARRVFLHGLAAAIGGFAAYQICWKVLLVALSVRSAYVETWIKTQEFLDAPAKTVARTLGRTWSLAAAGEEIFLGYGPVFLLLPAAGLVVAIVRIRRSRAQGRTRTALAPAGLLVAAAFAFAPILLSAGTIPARALISFAPLAAFLGGVAGFEAGRLEKALYFLLGATIFVSSWISVSLFYSDHLARQRDELLVARLVARMDDLTLVQSAARIPLVVVGAFPSSPDAVYRRVEVFGTSFFEHDGGNPWRIDAYMRLLGVREFEPRPITDVAGDLERIRAMPIWPAPHSLAMINGRLILKLGPFSYQQQVALDRLQTPRGELRPAPDPSATRQLFNRIVDRELGDAVGRVELRAAGILIHPGDTKPTAARFRLDGEIHSLVVHLQIAPLDEQGLKVPEAGTVNAEFLLDGKSVFRTYVDRTSQIDKVLDLSGGRQLVVRVDNANGKSWWDWFVLSVVSVR